MTLVRSLVLASAALVATLPAAAQTTIFVDGGRGPVPVRLPAGHDPVRPAPLVFLLHGYSNTGPQEEAYVRIGTLADEFGFVYVTPTGTTDLINNPFWNATDACCDLAGTGVDDSGYLRALIDAIRAQVEIDDKRIWITGRSNGGFMSYRMACDHADLVAAAVSISGATYANASLCMPSEPVHTLEVHGTSDNVINYGGGTISAPYPGAVQTAQTWATYDGCTLIVDTSSPRLDLDSSLVGDETNVDQYVDACSLGGSAELWTIQGADHSPVWTAQFPRLVVEFLFAHPKPGAVTFYCTGKTSSVGCVPFLTTTGEASVSSTQPFNVRANDVLENESGFLLYSFKRANLDFHGGKLCVKAPVTRVLPPKPAKTTGSAPCAGSLTRNFNARIQSGADPSLTAGQPVALQWLARDPADPTTFGDSLTDGARFVITP